MHDASFKPGSASIAIRFFFVADEYTFGWAFHDIPHKGLGQVLCFAV
jgi:hypothetical protein